MTSQWIVVVDRQRPDLYTALRRQLGGRAVVIFDRRTATRPPEPAGECRRPLALADAVLWQEHGCLVLAPTTSSVSDTAPLRAEVRHVARQLGQQASSRVG
jgi:hypothetical protein